MDRDIMVALANALITIDQAERGGEIALRGFAYQAAWGINYLLEKQKSRASYLFLFEYHDDILILDSSYNPTSAEFVQVKTKKDGKWTMSAVTSATKAKPKSFVSKLYEHFFQFVGHDISLILLSNAGFDFLKDNADKGSDLSETDQKNISQKVQSQLGITHKIPLEKIRFNTADLSLLDPHSHLYGKVAVFLNSYFGDDHGVSSTAFTELLIKTCNEKVMVASGDIKTFQDLVERKGISSEFVTELLSSLIANIKITPKWEHVCMLLGGFNDAFEQIKLQAIFKRISTQILNVNSLYYVYFHCAQKELLKRDEINLTPVRQIFSETESQISLYSMQDFSLLKKDERFMINVYSIIKLTFEAISNEE